jgi:hypothetical protein
MDLADADGATSRGRRRNGRRAAAGGGHGPRAAAPLDGRRGPRATRPLDGRRGPRATRPQAADGRADARSRPHDGSRHPPTPT